MKAASIGNILLTGPLSRNNSIKDLKPGDIVDVQLLEIRSKKTALVDFKGNKIELAFSSPVDMKSSFRLECVTFSPESIIFKLHENKNDLSDILRYTVDIAGKLNSQEKIKTVIANVPGLFDFLRIVADKKIQSKDPLPLLKMLMSQGFPISDIPFASAVLSGSGDREAIFFSGIIASLLENDFMSDAVYPEEVLHNQQADVLTETDGFRRMYYIFDGEMKRIDVIEGDDFYAGRLETLHAGVVEFYLRGSANISVLISTAGEVCAFMKDHADDLSQRLKSYYKGITVNIMPENELRKKILDFAQNLGNRSFDVRV